MTSSPFSPQSELARVIASLFTTTLLVLAVILAIVTFLIVYALVRFRSRGAGEPSQRPPPRWPEYAWTAGPVAVVVLLFVLAVTGATRSDPDPGDRAPDLVIVGHQWWWEYRFPGQGGFVTANELHLPVGRRLLARLESADVIHDYWVPNLGRKMDATPGHPAHLWLEADTPGVYLGACAEYCGVEHAWMRIRIVAEPPADYERWLASQAAVPPPAAGDAAAGEKLFHDRSCVSCHAVGGSGGRIAPDLTHLPSRATLAAGASANDRGALARWLADPQQVKPGTLMPNLHLTPDEIRQLVAYLWRP